MSLALDERVMTFLPYRGKEYLQYKEATPKITVELSYIRNVYTPKQAEARNQMPLSLLYRGIQYQK